MYAHHIALNDPHVQIPKPMPLKRLPRIARGVPKVGPRIALIPELRLVLGESRCGN